MAIDRQLLREELNGTISLNEVMKTLKNLGIDIYNPDISPNLPAYVDKTTRRILCKYYSILETECREKLESQSEFVTNYRTVHEIIRKKVVSKEYALP